jgi:NAD(P)-dependent dehydrogenase (short-subunit alcohol dehydrogenase family)
MSNIGKSKVALVTGSSTGIGYETCLALARNSFVTCATMRDKKNLEIWRELQGTKIYK